MTVEPSEGLEALAATEPTPRPHATLLVVANPHATTLSARIKDLVVRALESRYEVEVADTQKSGHATQICREAAREGYDAVVAFGGDGTVNEAANGLMGSETPMAVLPGGATNVFCRMLGVPNDVVDATAHLIGLADAWQPRSVDLGMLDDRAFTFAAGVGIDASVVERVDANPALKARFGAWYFGHAAVSAFLRRYVLAAPQLEVAVDGRTLRGVSAFFQNATPYTYFGDRPVALAEDPGLQSGKLSGVVLARANPLDLPSVAARALSGGRLRVGEHRQVAAFEHVERVVVRSQDGRAVPVQVDGDHLGSRREVVLSVRRAALRIVA